MHNLPREVAQSFPECRVKVGMTGAAFKLDFCFLVRLLRRSKIA